MKRLDMPFLDLFEMLQSNGMTLSPEQYDLLRKALAKGFGLENWERDWSDLRDLCRVLWVKPSSNYDEHIFEQTFSQYVQQKQREIRKIQPRETQVPSSSQPKAPERRLPQVPPRRIPTKQPENPQIQTPVAVKTGATSWPEVDDSDFHLTPRNLPFDPRTVLDSWRFLQRPMRQGLEYELDLNATITCITQQGYFSDVVMRLVLNKQAELLVLVDDSNVMLPFAPALNPLVNAIEERQITPAKLYRFTTYPDEYLYHWQQPAQAIPLASVLARMHPRRTIVMIWSEAGATSRTLNAEHRYGLVQFLARLSPCLRDLIWLNPLPPERWTGTLAHELAHQLDGRMIHLDVAQLLYLSKQPPSTDRFHLRALF